LQGDMPRHLMNGVFFMDALYDLPFGSIGEALEYARHYYARYPALSIGHHPFLIALAEAPVYAVFGVSVTSARLVVLAFFVLGVVYLYKLVSELFDEWAGAAAAAVLASSGYLVEVAQGVMTEVPALSLMIAAVYYCHRFATTEQSRAILAATLLAAASAWAKQLAVMVVPGMMLYVWWRVGWQRILRRDVIVATLLSAVLVAPLLPMTFVLSPFNVATVTSFAMTAGEGGRFELAVRTLGQSLRMQLTLPIILFGAAGLVLLCVRRHPAAFLAGAWIGCVAVFVGLIGAAPEPARYSLYWVPAWALCVGALCSRRVGSQSVVVGALVIAAIALQVSLSARIRLPAADGYEQAAIFVVEHPVASTVMFAGDVDTGYFTFFVRKHDPARRAIVLRADKLLTTSMMGSVAAEDRISNPEQIHDIVRRYGVGYVVIEDRPSASNVQNWLVDVVKTARYVERLRLPTHSTDVRLRGTDLVVYEVVGATAAAPDARLDIRLPLVSQEIDVALSDLLNRKYLR
jgi:Dolichyl-phosphate-mannose-protein mannosyltransferase